MLHKPQGSSILSAAASTAAFLMAQIQPVLGKGRERGLDCDLFFSFPIFRTLVLGFASTGKMMILYTVFMQKRWLVNHIGHAN